VAHDLGVLGDVAAVPFATDLDLAMQIAQKRLKIRAGIVLLNRSDYWMQCRTIAR
jgi:hypothetical protein